MQNASNSPYLPISNENTEIRLLHLSAGGFDDPIHISLTVHAVTEPPKYEALSYVWGHELCKTSAIVNDCPLEITENLDTALRHLRYESDSRTLWIDAICINQNDTLERNQQVQLMSQIYPKSSRVVAWLGPSADGSDIIMDRFIRGSLEDPGDEELDPWMLHYSTRLFGRPWFSRVWIVQEVALAPESSIIRCGDRSVLMHKMRNMVQDYIKQHMQYFVEILTDTSTLLRHGQKPPRGWVNLFCDVNPHGSPRSIVESFRQLPTSGNQPEFASHVRWCILRFLIRFAHARDLFRLALSPTDLSFHDLIDRTQFHEATDPRDKIYSVLAISCFTAPENVIVPNYSQPVQIVYSKAMATIILEGFHKSYPALPLLQEHQRQTQRLPSWVPDFVMGPETQSREFLWQKQTNHQTLAAVTRHCFPETSHIEKLVRVASQKEPVAAFLADYKIMQTKGIPLGFVTASTRLSHVTTHFSKLHCFIQEHDIAVPDLVRTLIGFQGFYEPDVEFLISIFERVYEEYLKGNESPFDMSLDADKHLRRTMKNSANEGTLFITDTGRVGMSIGQLEPGDLLAGLFRINCPFILRAKGDGYTMVNVARVANHTWGHDMLLNQNQNIDQGHIGLDFEEYVIY